MDTKLLQVLAFGSLGLLRNTNNNTASSGSNSGSASKSGSGSTGVPVIPPFEEYTDVDTGTPPKDGKPSEMPSNPNYYRLGDTTRPYDPFYDYSDKWSRDRLGYVDGKFSVPASGSGHLIRMRMFPESFRVYGERAKFNFINLKDTVDFYKFSFNIEIFNPFDVDIHFHSLILDDLNGSGAIQYRGVDMLPYMEDVARSYHTKAPDGRAMAKRDEILTYLLHYGYPYLNESILSGYSIMFRLRNLGNLPVPVPLPVTDVTIKSGSSSKVSILLSTPNGFGYYSWSGLKYKLDTVFDNNDMFSVGLRYKMDNSPEVYLSNINIKGGNSPAIVPAKWWEYQYVGTDVGNFKL